MASDSRWGMTPRQSIERECARRGRTELVDGCRALLRGEAGDADLLIALGGPAARPFVGEADEDTYWTRVWAARGLLWAWDDSAVPEIRRALTDESWRVREMALKVVARHRLGDLLADAAAGRADPVRRVRAASERALTVLTVTGA